MNADSQLQPMDREESNGFRFGLLALFYITAVFAAAIALMGPAGICWAALVIAFWLMRVREIKKAKSKPIPGQFLSNSRSGFSWGELILVIAIIGIIIGMALPSVRRIRPAAYRVTHINSMRQICLAFHNYESAYGHFPPAYIADENGKPMHSWRVLILPFIEENAVYEQYDFDEPWDGPNNSKLVDKLSYQGFFNFLGDDQNQTGFKLVTGPGAVFGDGRKPTFGDIKAGSSNTIMLVDDNTKRVNWMSPEDVSIDEVTKLFDIKNKDANISMVEETKFGKTSYYFSSVGLFDGSAQSTGFLDDPSVMREYFTADAIPAVPLNDIVFKYKDAQHEVKPEGYILVAINFVLAILPAFWINKKALS